MIDAKSDVAGSGRRTGQRSGHCTDAGGASHVTPDQEGRTMQRQSNKVGPRLDEDLKHDSEAIVRGGHASRAEEWKGSEPAAEDQPAVRLRPELAEAKVSLDGSGEGMSAAEIELRSELATYIARAPYPLGREDLLALLAQNNAPDRFVEMVERLPADQAVVNLQDLWERVGQQG
jgi:hypothetical protein